MNPTTQQKINVLCMILVQYECNECDMSIVFAIRQFTSMATSKIVRELGLKVGNANSLEINPYDGYSSNEERVKHIKSRLEEIKKEL